jgi:polysaccharide biosynthesis transport protein
VSQPATANRADVRFYVKAVMRRKWLVLMVFTAVVSVVSLWATRQPKVYAAAATIIVDAKEPRFLDSQIQDIQAEATASFWSNREYFETQIRILTSKAVAARVVEKLGLQNDPIFLGVSKLPAEQQQAVMAKVDARVLVQSRVRVEPVKDTKVLAIRIEDGDPHRAALLANEVAQAYIEEMMAQKLKLTENASRWLDERRDTLATSAQQSELALYTFRKQSDMLSTSLDDRAGMVSQRLTATSSALTEAQLKIAGLKARVAAIRSVQKEQGQDDRLWAEALPAARESQAIKDYKTRLVLVRNECAELSNRYLGSHPKLLECGEKLALAEKDFARELSNLVLGTEAELKEAQEKERNLSGLLAQAKVDAFEVEKKKLELDRLKKESDNTQRQYDVVFKRLKDIELSGLLRTSNVRVLDPAQPNLAPIRPNTSQSILLGLLAGLLGGIGLALLLEFLDSSITTQSEIEERLGMTFLGVMPRLEEGTGKDLFMHREPKSVIAECMRAVRTNLLFMSPDKPIRRMLVTSSGPQEGKSTTCINLGIAMAQNGSRVLLIDTDMRRPRLHKAFEVPNDVGVSSLVVGEGRLEDAIKSTLVPGLFVMPCGPIPPNPAELLHTKAFADLLDQLAGKFDRVVLDSPPVAAVADGLVLATLVDGVLLVVKSGKTNREVAKRTLRSLRDVKAPLFGAVLNDVDLARSSYGEYYGYGYRYYGYTEKKEA